MSTTETTPTEKTPTSLAAIDNPPTERAWLLVARREVTTRLADKAFLIGTLITLVVLVGFIGWTAWSEQRSETYTVATTSDGAATAQLLAQAVPEVDDGIEIEVQDVASDDDGVALLEDGEADVLLRPADDGWTLVGQKEVPDDLSEAASTAVRDATLNANAERAGTSLQELQQGSSVDTLLLEGDAERQEFAKAMGLMLAFLFYFAALGLGYTLSGSVVEEKANRIVEIITTKIPVRQLLIGKIAGNTLLAIGQTALIVSVGLVGISFTEYSSYLSGISEGVGLVRRVLPRRVHLHRLLVGRRRCPRQPRRGPADDSHTTQLPDDGRVLRRVPLRGDGADGRVVPPAVLDRPDADPRAQR